MCAVQGCEYDQVELEALRALPPEDQRTFLLGRILAETSRMDLLMRFLNAVLRGEREVSAYLDSPDNFTRNSEDCLIRIRADSDLDLRTREALLASVQAAIVAYKRRNRFVHDLLQEDMLFGDWELMPLRRVPGGNESGEKVSFDSMVQVVEQLITATIRLRGGAMHVLQGGWDKPAFGPVRGAWDGTAVY